MTRFASGGKIHAGEETAEFYKALVETGRGRSGEHSESKDRQESHRAAGPSHSIPGPSITPAVSTRQAASSARAQGGAQPEEQEAAFDVSKKGIGYAMLAKSGWRGGGLGAEEQGITSPLPAWHNPGRRGIGAAPKQGRAAAKAGEEGQPGGATGGRQLGVGEVVAGAKGGKRGQQAEVRPTAKPPKQAWASVSVEEPAETKLKRVKQVLQAEADDAAEKALSRALFRAFSDAGGYSSTDNNPLLRRNKLSQRNPLL